MRRKTKTKIFEYSETFAQPFDSFDAICGYEPEQNEYGYCVDISDPRIREKYEKYKKKKKIPPHFLCTDDQRLDFEQEIKKEFSKKYPEHYARIRKYIQDEGEKK